MQILPEKFSIVVVEELPQFDFAVLKSLTGLVVSIVPIGSYILLAFYHFNEVGNGISLYL